MTVTSVATDYLHERKFVRSTLEEISVCMILPTLFRLSSGTAF